MADVLRPCFDRILDAYLEARALGSIEPQHPVASDFEELRQLLSQHIHLAAHDDIQVRWSVGRGSWSKVPWLGVFDERETKSAQNGMYIVYLFCENMQGVYLGLGYGVQALLEAHGTKKAYAMLAKKIKPIKSSMSWLSQSGFELGKSIDLRSEGRLAKAYEHGIFIHKYYDRDHFPNDAQIIQDLDELLDAYDAHVTGDVQVSQTWLLRCEDRTQETYALKLRAKDALPQVGDDVYFWEEDQLTGHARVLSVRSDGVNRRQIRLGLQAISFWPDTITQDQLSDVKLKAADLPTPRHHIKPVHLTLEQAIGCVLKARAAHFDMNEEMARLLGRLAHDGWLYAPWQVAAYVTALRTKPFVILAGISGTGKSKLPALIAQHTGGRCGRVPVRPDWSDSADVLGYMDLNNQWRPGQVLSMVQVALNETNHHHVCVLDEMNLARVEQYFAEVLSAMEDRTRDPMIGWRSASLLSHQVALDSKGRDWSTVFLPSNFAVVGTVNMDESTHGFSTKVLDRAFTLELSEVDLKTWQVPETTLSHHRTWPLEVWQARATRLAQLEDLSEEDTATIDHCVDVLSRLNGVLRHVQSHVGYRTRDEVALFVLHGEQMASAFCTTDGVPVSILDVAISMKVLPRLEGGTMALRDVLARLLHWGFEDNMAAPRADHLDAWIARWLEQDRPTMCMDAVYPLCAARLCLMWQRLMHEGFTSYWT